MRGRTQVCCSATRMRRVRRRALLDGFVARVQCRTRVGSDSSAKPTRCAAHSYAYHNAALVTACSNVACCRVTMIVVMVVSWR
jgi:hypothetical protein